MCIGIPSSDRWLGHPGRVGVRATVTHSTATSPRRPWPRRVPEDLGLEHIHGEIVHQFRVEVVVAHRPRRRVCDAASDDPRPGAVHPTEFVPGVQRRVEVVEAGGDRRTCASSAGARHRIGPRAGHGSPMLPWSANEAATTVPAQTATPTPPTRRAHTRFDLISPPFRTSVPTFTHLALTDNSVCEDCLDEGARHGR